MRFCFCDRGGEGMVVREQGWFSFRRSKPDPLTIAVSRSWSMTILLCFKNGSPRRIFVQRSGAIKALMGREVHALFKEEGVITT